MPDPYFLSRGSHATANQGRCAMEWVSYLAGEPHSATPGCVSPVLIEFCVKLNDVLPDDERQKLRPYLARTIGTREDGHDQERRWLASDWLIRTYTPAWLTLAGLDAAADRLRSLPAVLTSETLSRAVVDLRSAEREADAAWNAAWNAAWSAAWSAARDAARDAARTAAWAAARDAAWSAAWNAARDAAADAAWNAGWAAARDAARAALQPTVKMLQRSAVDLLDQMLPAEAIQLPVAVDAELVCAGGDER